METREKIVEAAERVMRAKGIAHSTTKEIAQAAGVSEGSLYNHFGSKEDLFLCVLHERMPNFIGLVKTLPERAGGGTLSANLTEVATSALAFYSHTMPLVASIFSTPELLARHREGMQKHNAGPNKANEALAAYLRAEQQLGRISGDADTEAAAGMLLGACFQQAFLTQFLGESMSAEATAHSVSAVVLTLLRSLQPTNEL